MQEKLYSMKKELAELLGRDRLLKSAVKEVNKLDMIKASMAVSYTHLDVYKRQGLQGDPGGRHRNDPGQQQPCHHHD